MKPFLVGGIPVQYPIILGAGALRYPSQLASIMRSDIPLGVVTLGSVVPAESTGNDGSPLFWPDHWSEFLKYLAGLNSFGMPSLGPEKTIAQLPLKTLIPLAISIAANTPEGFCALAADFDPHPAVCALDFNTACPNLKKIPMGFDLEAMEKLLYALRQMKLTKPMWLKIPRYITKVELQAFASAHPEFDFSATPIVSDDFIFRFANLIKEFTDVVRAVIAANTLGNVVRRLPNGKTVTAPNEGRAGLSGPIIKQNTLELVAKLSILLPPEVDIIASGGLITGDDACDCFEEHVAAVSFTSAPFWHGNPARFFADLPVGSERLQNHLMQHSQ